MRRSEIDEGSLIEIFTRIGGDVRDLLRCSLVCKRWNNLCWAVPALDFDFKTVMKLNEEEAIISNVLKRTAPNCLQELKVLLHGLPREQVQGEWLVHVGKCLKKLNLNYWGQWGSPVGSMLSSFKCLESLAIRGNFMFLTPVPPFQSLTSCSLINNRILTVDMLEALLAASPVLKDLVVKAFPDEHPGMLQRSVRLFSASLESLEILEDNIYVLPNRLSYLVSLDTPMLVRLTLGLGASKVNMKVVSADNLSELQLRSACVICSDMPAFRKLEKLKLTGIWATGDAAALWGHTPGVTDFEMFDGFNFSGSVMSIGEVFVSLTNLKTLTFDAISVQSFQASWWISSSRNGIDFDSEFLLEELTVHLWMSNGLEEQDYVLDVLRSLLDAHRIRLLVVHYDLQQILRQQLDYYKEWRILLDLVLLYPGRIEFKQE